ncbi:MAG TPA: hypothetical protein VF616_05750 [Duganella sp.]|uniref:hypothetical protein n=1 Tax=Duganella sp. TaxID=1904440 RepID=UPI002ED09754
MVSSSVISRLLVLGCLSACAPAPQEATPPTIAASGTASRTGCAPPAPATATSKLRHIPDENDPCANSRGMPPR